MYGEPLKPEDCIFFISSDEDGEIILFIKDATELDNDNIREVIHPDFDTIWDNMAENVFMANDGFFESDEDAIKWCLSIGMVQKV